MSWHILVYSFYTTPNGIFVYTTVLNVLEDKLWEIESEVSLTDNTVKQG